MLYAIVFLVLIVAILVIWLVRVVNARYQRSHARHHGSTLPSQIQDVSGRPTLIGTAQEVRDRVFARPHDNDPESYSPYQTRQSRERRDVGAVNRLGSTNASVTSLPAYGAESLPVPPHATYDPSRGRSGISPSFVPLYPDAPPPKYTAATTTTGITV
ncbi:uncharacterized protein IL334_006599 [Kwoniella shivajii]|uniref:Uncharacterized protein n=1 Tax=Kwoniella shivajii TaxID=564305 RepID=A0ABZ1D6D6_9TREE|nr:hypothetical protein IL334_006599 [Kwoniella shivajii]